MTVEVTLQYSESDDPEQREFMTVLSAALRADGFTVKEDKRTEGVTNEPHDA